MNWQAAKADWPFADHSRFARIAPHEWHIQEVGSGPDALLLHGAGGATQSFRHLIPELSPHLTLRALDLPGQGFTRLGARHRCGLDDMATDIATVIADQGWRPRVLIGHSAGAAIALRLAEMMPDPPPVIGINAAIGKFSGLAGVFFPIMAKTLAALPFVADIFSASAGQPGSVKRLIEGTGSRLDDHDLRFYRRLIADRDHVNGTLLMMAQWDLDPLLDRLPDLAARVLLITGANDRAVPARTSTDQALRMEDAQHISLPGLGHLAHEEDAPTVAQVILTELRARGVL